jgi:hypothetical protein
MKRLILLALITSIIVPITLAQEKDADAIAQASRSAEKPRPMAFFCLKVFCENRARLFWFQLAA